MSLTLTARRVTAVLKAAGFDLIRSSTVTEGVVRVEQLYATCGALTPADTRARREARARLIAGQLIAEGYEAVRINDRVTVTLPEPVEYDGPADDDECGQCGSPRSSARHTPLGHPFVEAPVIVRAGEAAPLAEQEAPRQDLDAPRALTDESVAPTVEALVAETLRGGYPTVSAYLTAPGREDLCARVTPWLLDRAIRAFRAELDRRARIEALRNADPDDEPEVRSGTGPERQRHAEFLAELLVDEPGPEVDDPREQPRPVVWSEVATPSLPVLDGRPRALRYRR